MKRRKQTVLFCLLLLQFTSNAQKIFSENFSDTVLHSYWNIIAGNWQISDVQEMRIAPAEDGYQYVLCTQGQSLIRLIVDIPDTVKASKLQIQFSYYTYLKGPGASVEIEFHKRQQKDGTKGKLFKANLPVKSRWVIFKKILPIPASADAVYIVFETNKSTANTSKKVCFDSVQIFAMK